MLNISHSVHILFSIDTQDYSDSIDAY